MSGPIAQLENVYTAAHSTGNKQEELEAQFLVPQESYGVAATTETCWDDSHAWTAAINSSEETGKEGEAGGQLCMLGAVLTVWSLVM